jgi:hypothetical protein
MNHGATGWSNGLNMHCFIADTTAIYGTGQRPVPTDAWAYTHSGVTGGTTTQGDTFFISADYPISAAESGTRSFGLYIYITNVALTAAKLLASNQIKSFIRAEIV